MSSMKDIMELGGTPPDIAITSNIGAEFNIFIEALMRRLEAASKAEVKRVPVYLLGCAADAKTQIRREIGRVLSVEDKIARITDDILLVYSNDGESRQWGENMGLVTEPLGKIPSDQYRRNSLHRAMVTKFSRSIPLSKSTIILEINESAAGTSSVGDVDCGQDPQEIIGNDRGQTFVSTSKEDNSLVAAIVGSPRVVEKGLRAKELARKTPLEGLRERLGAEDIEDSRDPSVTQREAVLSGHELARSLQENDIFYIARMWASSDQIEYPDPYFDLKDFRKHYEAALKYMANVYWPRWMRLNLGERFIPGNTVDSNAFVFYHDLVEEGTKVYWSDDMGVMRLKPIKQISMAQYIDLRTQEPQYQYLREAFADMGVLLLDRGRGRFMDRIMRRFGYTRTQ